MDENSENRDTTDMETNIEKDTNGLKTMIPYLTRQP